MQFRLDFIMEANTLNPDQTAPKEQSDLGPYCLQYRLYKNINTQEQTRKAMTDGKMVKIWSLLHEQLAKTWRNPAFGHKLVFFLIVGSFQTFLNKVLLKHFSQTQTSNTIHSDLSIEKYF